MQDNLNTFKNALDILRYITVPMAIKVKISINSRWAWKKKFYFCLSGVNRSKVSWKESEKRTRAESKMWLCEPWAADHICPCLLLWSFIRTTATPVHLTQSTCLLSCYVTAEGSSRNEERMADKAQNACSLVSHRKSLPTSGLKSLLLLGPTFDKVACPEAWRHDERTQVIH